MLIARAMGDDEQARERGFPLALPRGQHRLFRGCAVRRVGACGARLGDAVGGAAAASLLSAGLLRLSLSRLQSHRADADGTHLPPAAASRRGNMAAVWLLCSVAVVFWLTAQQAGSSLAVFAAVNTEQQITCCRTRCGSAPALSHPLHGLMVIAMLPAFLYLHGRSHSRTSSTAGILVWGYVATAAAFALMTGASLHGGMRAGSVAPGSSAAMRCSRLQRFCWLHSAYPWSLAWPRDTGAAQSVGLWFAGSAVGNGLAAVLGLCWDRWPHHRYFAALAAVSLAAAVPLLSRRRHLDWLTALTVSAASQPAVEKETQPMNPAPNPNPESIAAARYPGHG